jgi:hypothetical protein
MLALPGSEHTLTDMHAGFATTLLAWLWMGGTYTHWITLTYFKKISPFFPKVSGLTWRELCKTGAKTKPNPGKSRTKTARQTKRLPMISNFNIID